ncbi:hypothetical protein [Roseateles noduli]|uniref:hypothetical protein n=1 Tax=Roseateles noduli TaxID=2052484 RepID=UPI003D65522D
MPSDALLVSVANYPISGHLLRALPGAARDSSRVGNWLRSQPQPMGVQEFVWPSAPPPANNVPSWNYRSVEASLHHLLATGMASPRDRLFLYASAHGRSAPSAPAMPGIFCATHGNLLPDVFMSSGWVPQMTAVEVYREYLCFFDCCNDWQPGTFPPYNLLNLPPRTDRPSVFVVAACMPNQQALDTPTGGVFTDVLLEAMSGSAGQPGKTDVTAADVLAYLKENVPLRAAQLKPGHVQNPVEWCDPYSHARLEDFVLFQRQVVGPIDVAALLAGQAAADVEVMDAALQPLGPLSAGPAGEAFLPPVLPGKYMLREGAGVWSRTIVVKSVVLDDGSVSAVATARP